MVIYSGEKMKSGTDNFRLRVWLYDKAQFDKTAAQNITMNVSISAKAS